MYSNMSPYSPGKYSFRDAFFTRFSIWSFQESLEFIVTPSNLALVPVLIGLPSTCIGGKLASW